MKNNKIFFNSKILYIFFITLSLNIFFCPAVKSDVKSFDINNIDISRPFEINFNKNEVIDEGFKEAFSKLTKLILNSSDQKKVKSTKINEIKGMIESFSIKEEKFINEIYYVNLGVSFNKKKIYNYLEKKNVFPSIPVKKKILFIPVIINESNKELLIFSGNEIFKIWNDDIKNFHLIEYILPTEDLEDLRIIKKNYDSIENYNFKEIISKYDLTDNIVALIFKGKKKARILSKINIQKNVVIMNQSFVDLEMNDNDQVKKIVNTLKTIYEDNWKDYNQINTSIKLPLNIKIDNYDILKILNFEKNMTDSDLIYDFFITKFDKNFTYYQIIFNGTPNIFLKNMSEKNYEFDTQNRVWILK